MSKKKEDMFEETVDESKVNSDTDACATADDQSDAEACNREAEDGGVKKEADKSTQKVEEKVENKKDPKDAVIEDLQDRVKRQMAEFDNFRKRTEKEKSAMFEMGASDVIKKLLPIVDNFERGFKSISEEELGTPFAKGMDMVYKQTVKMLNDMDVKPIESVGSEFNPDFHNAVMHIEDDSVGENIIVEEFEKGYTYRDTVIRHSMVKVAN